MTLKEILDRWGRKTPAVYAGLCTARADGSDTRYVPGERYAVLAMARASENEAETTMAELLHAQGWNDVAVLEYKLLDVPFLSDDREVRACYVNAMTSDGGVIVYDEPVEDLDASMMHSSGL